VAQITIRTADESDVPALIEYLTELRAERLPTIFRYDGVPTPEEEVEFLEQFSGENADFFVALDAQAIVGNLGVVARGLPQTCHNAGLGMSVLATYRNRGVGSRLMDTVIEWAKQRPIRRLELEVLGNNPGARRFYERKGFALEGCRSGAVEVDGTYVDALIMALVFEPAV
jgi:RimJ/RimL family protein N-acetyltransferase